MALIQAQAQCERSTDVSVGGGCRGCQDKGRCAGQRSDSDSPFISTPEDERRLNCVIKSNIFVTTYHTAFFAPVICAEQHLKEWTFLIDLSLIWHLFTFFPVLV